jgi:hypothetical protein
MNHRELGETYLTLLEAVKHTGLSEEGAVLHSEEIWMYCPRVPMKEQLIKDTEADVVSNWIGMSEVSGETEMPVCAKLTDPSKEQFHLRLKKGNHDLKSLRAINQDVSGATEEIELQHPNPLSISPTSNEDPSCEPVQPTLYVTRAGLE